MNDIAERGVIDGNIAYFKFTKGTKPEDFVRVFPEFEQLVQKPEITNMIVDIQMDDVWGAEIQQVWLETGARAEQAGIQRWGVVAVDESKRMTIRHLIQGGRARDRRYATIVSADLDEVLQWIRGGGPVADA